MLDVGSIHRFGVTFDWAAAAVPWPVSRNDSSYVAALNLTQIKYSSVSACQI